MAGDSTSGEATLKETPTWAVAVVCAFMIFVSILIEHLFHLLAKFLKRRKRKSLNQALHKIRAELMLLGFMSLLLTFAQQPISKICIPKRMGNSFLPCDTSPSDDFIEESTCQKRVVKVPVTSPGYNPIQGGLLPSRGMQLYERVITPGLPQLQFNMWVITLGINRYLHDILKIVFVPYKCVRTGQISLLSTSGVNELQFLIFVLAVFHVLSCTLTMGLGIAKMRRWKYWEEETRSLEYQFSNDPRRFRLTKQTSFGKRHLRFWSDHPLLLWPACFLRQFFGSVFKTDYFALRHGFITAHFAVESKFNFQKFLRRTLDEDFPVVVGISLWIWTFSVLFIFLQAHGFYNYLWLPFIPLIMALIVGTKLQVIITKMCLDSRDESVVVRGTLLVKPNDNLFWFDWPRLLLHLIHFILFQNSFQLAFLTWTWYKFGMRSCFHRKTEEIVIRIVMPFLVQLLIGYVTLPLYVLVTKMGSSMRKVVFTERVSEGLKKWHTSAKRHTDVNTRSSLSNGPSPDPSPSHTLSSPAESEIREFEEGPSPEGDEFIALQISREDPLKLHSKTNGSYDGEISFAWLQNGTDLGGTDGSQIRPKGRRQDPT